MKTSNNDHIIKIAEVLGDGKTGGIISCLMNFYRNIDKEHFKIDFYMNEPTPYYEEIKSLGGQVFYYPKITSPVKSYKTLEKYFLEGKYDIVHTHMTTLSLLSMRVAKKTGVPIRICHSHSTSNIREGVRWIAKGILKPFSTIYPTDLCACSKLSADWLYGKKDAFILHNAIDCNKFSVDSANNKQLKQELGIEGKKVVGFVGRLEKQKNIPYLIEIFNDLYKIRQDVVLLMVGSGSKKETATKLINKYSLQNQVFIMPECSDVEKYYCLMNVFCLPSLYEGLPLVAVESQSMGLPTLVSTNVTKEVAITPLVEFLSLNDRKLWVDRIGELLDNPPCEHINIRGTCYDIKYETKNLENYYRKLVEGK